MTTSATPLSDANLTAALLANISLLGFSIGREEQHRQAFEYLGSAWVRIRPMTMSGVRAIYVRYQASQYVGRDDTTIKCPLHNMVADFDPVMFETALRVMREKGGKCDNSESLLVADLHASPSHICRVIMHALKILHEECSKV